MSDSYKRLIDSARQLKGLDSPADVARYLGKYDQIMTNWKARGIQRAEIMDIAELIGCNPYWLRDGKGDMIDYSADAKISAVAHAMQNMSEYKKDVLVQTSTALIERPRPINNKTQ